MAVRATRGVFLVATIVMAALCGLSHQTWAQSTDSTPYQGTDTPQAELTLPQDVVEAVWATIDANQDGRASDREAYAATKPLRVIGNAKQPSELRKTLRKAADANNDDLLSKAEALAVIAKVRGIKCPTAKQAKVYFDRLDKDRSQTLSPEEVRATLEPLGNVGNTLFEPVAITVKTMDLTGDNIIDSDELYLSANAMLRVQLATDGPGIADRDPDDWLKFVNAVAYLDIDADNQVSLLEATRIRAIGGQFASIDRNRDQHISPGELCEFQAELDLRAYLSSVSSVGGS